MDVGGFDQDSSQRSTLPISEFDLDLSTPYFSIVEGNHACSRVFLQISQRFQIEHIDVGDEFVLIEGILDHDLIVVPLKLGLQHIGIVRLNDSPPEVIILDSCNILRKLNGILVLVVSPFSIGDEFDPIERLVVVVYGRLQEVKLN